MFKKNKIIIFFFILTLLLNSVTAFAEPATDIKPLKDFTVTADITEVEEFNYTIYVYIYDSENHINVFGLNKDNNFTSTYEFPLGDAKLFKVMIEDENGTEINLPFTSEGSLTVKSDEEGKFTIKIYKDTTNNENNTINIEDSDSEKNVDNSEDNKIDEDKMLEISKEKEAAKKRHIINLIVDIILITFFSAILGYLKYKEKKQKKESGEK